MKISVAFSDCTNNHTVALLMFGESFLHKNVNNVFVSLTRQLNIYLLSEYPTDHFSGKCSEIYSPFKCLINIISVNLIQTLKVRLESQILNFLYCSIPIAPF